MITLRKLEIFAAVANSQSVSGSANRLMLSQSAVSMAIADLESNCDSQLFRRQGRKLILNNLGRQLLPQASEILERVEQFKQTMKASQAEPTGRLLIGASTTIGNYLLPLLIADFSRQYPQAQLSMQVGNSEEIAEALDSGSLDLALIEGPCHISHLERYDWQEDELVVVCGRNHPCALSTSVATDQLFKEQWIIRERGSGTREIFEQALGIPASQLASIVEMGHTEAIKKAVEAGLGIGCLSRLTVQREVDQGWLIELKTPLHLKRTLSLLLPYDCQINPLLQACLSLLMKDEFPFHRRS